MAVDERFRKGKFIRFFDKTPEGINCPHFWILAWANGCVYQCKFCFLQSTLRYQGTDPVVFTNFDAMVKELRFWLAKNANQILNAGELSDSLALDYHYGLTEKIVPLFNEDEKNNKLLLLTKSINIDNLLSLNPRNVIVSFSLNSEEVWRMYEQGTPNPIVRIEAAKKLIDHGYTVRIRIDPIIPVEHWKEFYSPIISLVAKLYPDRVTLGTLRFFPQLKVQAEKNRPSDVFTAYPTEKTDYDGRYRLKDRLPIYEYFINQLVKAHYPKRKIGVCKETVEVVAKLGLNPKICNCTEAVQNAR